MSASFEREAGLALAVAHHQLERVGMPHLTGVPRLVGDQHYLQAPSHGLASDPADLLGLGAVAHQGHNTIDLIEQHAQRLGIEGTRDQHRVADTGQVIPSASAHRRTTASGRAR